jgi:hypothetical protein
MKLALALTMLAATAPAWAAPSGSDLKPAWSDYPSFFRVPAGQTTAVIHKSGSGSGSGKATVVVYFHGWRNCVNNVAYGKGCGGKAADPERGLVALYDAAKVPGETIFAMLEGPFTEALTLTPPGLAKAPSWMTQKPLPSTPGFFRDLVGKILTEAGRRPSDLGDVVLVGHSGAYGPMAAALDFGGLNAQISSVILLDATYVDLSPQVQKWRGERGSKRADLHIVFTPGGDAQRGADKLKSMATSFEPTTVVHPKIPDSYLGKFLQASFGAPKAAGSASAKPAAPSKAGKPAKTRSASH